MAPRSKSNSRKTKVKSSHSPLPTLHPHAAGIDVGAREVYVAVPPGADPRPVRRFETFTEDLLAVRDWLQACGVDSIALESTGVYWIPLFQILEAAGLEVVLVNARHCKNLPGRKTDVQDCQWLQYLHSVGLLRPSFRPADEVCAVRSILRHRESLVQGAAQCVNHLHKSLTQMNIQLQHVISDLTGVTGLAILEAILAGERDPVTLARLKDHRIKATREVIAKSLRGDWREEHLFTLRQSYALWQTHQQLITACDQQMESMLATVRHARGKRRGARARHHQPQEAAEERAAIFGARGMLPGAGRGPDGGARVPDAHRARARVRTGTGLCPEVPDRQTLWELAGAVPRQPHHRRENLPHQNARREEPRGHRAATGRAQPAPGAELLWRFIPEMEGPPGRAPKP